MAWIRVSYKGKAELAIIKGMQNSAKRLQVLENHLLPLIDAAREGEAVFQQDNCSMRVSHEAKAWFCFEEIELLGWPARSPGLKIAENAWGHLARKAHADGKQFETENELICALRREWARMP